MSSYTLQDLDCYFGYDRASVSCQESVCGCANGYYHRYGNICRRKSMGELEKCNATMRSTIEKRIEKNQSSNYNIFYLNLFSNLISPIESFKYSILSGVRFKFYLTNSNLWGCLKVYNNILDLIKSKTLFNFIKF